MTRDDVVRITESVLKDLRLEIRSGGFTDPNSRTVELKLGNETITAAYFDVVQTDEYEG